MIVDDTRGGHTVRNNSLVGLRQSNVPGPVSLHETTWSRDLTDRVSTKRNILEGDCALAVRHSSVGEPTGGTRCTLQLEGCPRKGDLALTDLRETHLTSHRLNRSPDLRVGHLTQVNHIGTSNHVGELVGTNRNRLGGDLVTLRGMNLSDRVSWLDSLVDELHHTVLP